MPKQKRPGLPSKIQVTLISADGTCPNGHKVGDKWIINRKTPEPGICLAAFHNLFNPIRVLECGGSYPMYADPDSYQTCCPDIRNRLIFEIKRLPVKAVKRGELKKV
jgi:uncharacterized repeat protein (TIGR04076 family)